MATTDSQEVLDFGNAENNQIMSILQVQAGEEGSSSAAGDAGATIQFVQASGEGNDGEGGTLILPQAIELNGERHVFVQQAQDSETGEILIVLQSETTGQQIALTPEALASSGLIQLASGNPADEAVALAVSQSEENATAGSSMVVVTSTNNASSDGVSIGLDTVASSSSSDALVALSSSMSIVNTSIPSQTTAASTNVVQSVGTPKMTTQLESQPTPSKDLSDTEVAKILTEASKQQSSAGKQSVNVLNVKDNKGVEGNTAENQQGTEGKNLNNKTSDSMDYGSAIIQVEDSNNSSGLESLMANAVVSGGDNNFVIMTTSEDGSVPTEINLADVFSAGGAAGQTFFIETSEGLMACTAATTGEDGTIQLVTDGNGTGALLNSSGTSDGNVAYALQSTAAGIELTPVSGISSGISLNQQQQQALQQKGKTGRQQKQKPVAPTQKSGETILVNTSGLTNKVQESSAVATAIKRRPIPSKPTRTPSAVNVTVTTQPTATVIPVQPDNSTTLLKMSNASRVASITPVTSSLLTASAPGPSQLAASRRTYSKKNNIVWLNPEQATISTISKPTPAVTTTASASPAPSTPVVSQTTAISVKTPPTTTSPHTLPVSTTSPSTAYTGTVTPVKTKTVTSTVFSGTKSTIPSTGITIMKTDATRQLSELSGKSSSNPTNAPNLSEIQVTSPTQSGKAVSNSQQQNGSTVSLSTSATVTPVPQVGLPPAALSNKVAPVPQSPLKKANSADIVSTKTVTVGTLKKPSTDITPILAPLATKPTSVTAPTTTSKSVVSITTLQVSTPSSGSQKKETQSVGKAAQPTKKDKLASSLKTAAPAKVITVSKDNKAVDDTKSNEAASTKIHDTKKDERKLETKEKQSSNTVSVATPVTSDANSRRSSRVQKRTKESESELTEKLDAVKEAKSGTTNAKSESEMKEQLKETSKQTAEDEVVKESKSTKAADLKEISDSKMSSSKRKSDNKSASAVADQTKDSLKQKKEDKIEQKEEPKKAVDAQDERKKGEQNKELIKKAVKDSQKNVAASDKSVAVTAVANVTSIDAKSKKADKEETKSLKSDVESVVKTPELTPSSSSQKSAPTTSKPLSTSKKERSVSPTKTGHNHPATKEQKGKEEKKIQVAEASTREKKREKEQDSKQKPAPPADSKQSSRRSSRVHKRTQDSDSELTDKVETPDEHKKSKETNARPEREITEKSKPIEEGKPENEAKPKKTSEGKETAEVKTRSSKKDERPSKPKEKHPEKESANLEPESVTLTSTDSVEVKVSERKKDETVKPKSGQTSSTKKEEPSRKVSSDRKDKSKTTNEGKSTLADHTSKDSNKSEKKSDSKLKSASPAVTESEKQSSSRRSSRGHKLATHSEEEKTEKEDESKPASVTPVVVDEAKKDPKKSESKRKESTGATGESSSRRSSRVPKRKADSESDSTEKPPVEEPNIADANTELAAIDEVKETAEQTENEKSDKPSKSNETADNKVVAESASSKKSDVKVSVETTDITNDSLKEKKPDKAEKKAEPKKDIEIKKTNEGSSKTKKDSIKVTESSDGAAVKEAKTFKGYDKHKSTVPKAPVVEPKGKETTETNENAEVSTESQEKADAVASDDNATLEGAEVHAEESLAVVSETPSAEVAESVSESKDHSETKTEEAQAGSVKKRRRQRTSADQLLRKSAEEPTTGRRSTRVQKRKTEPDMEDFSLWDSDSDSGKPKRGKQEEKKSESTPRKTKKSVEFRLGDEAPKNSSVLFDEMMSGKPKRRRSSEEQERPQPVKEPKVSKRKSSKVVETPTTLTPILKKTSRPELASLESARRASRTCIVRSFGEISNTAEEEEKRQSIASLSDLRSPAESYDYGSPECKFHVRHQSTSLSPFTPRGSGASYMCQKCGYKTTRMNNLVLHHKDLCTVVQNACRLQWENEIKKQTKKHADSTPSATQSKVKRRKLNKDDSPSVDDDMSVEPEPTEKSDSVSVPTVEEEPKSSSVSEPLLTASDDDEPASNNYSKKFGFDEKDIVWADYNNTIWPALVLNILESSKEVVVKLIDSSIARTRVTMPIDKVQSFDNAERNKRLLAEGKSHSKDAIVKAVQKAEDYSRKRCLGDDTAAAKLFGDLNVDYPEPLSDEERLEDDRMEDPPRDSSSPDKADGDPLKGSENDTDDSFVYTDLSETLAQWKERRRVSNAKLLQCIKDGKIENHLLGVYRETIPSDRHQKFKSGSDAEKSQLKHVPWFGPIDDEDQQEEIYDYCSQLFKSNFKPDGSFDTVAYLFEVWVPEAIVKAISRIRRIELKDAEAIFQRGVILSKSEKVELEKEIMKEQEKQTSTTESESTSTTTTVTTTTTASS